VILAPDGKKRHECETEKYEPECVFLGFDFGDDVEQGDVEKGSCGESVECCFEEKGVVHLRAE